MHKFLALILFASASAGAWAQPPPPPPPIPSPLELATIPGVSVTQQLELRKILVQGRDAAEALHRRQHAEFEALHTKYRGEHERLAEATDANVRKLLGEEGYKHFAEWQLAQRRGPPHAGPPGMRGGPRDGMRHMPAEPHPENAPGRAGDE